MDTLLFALNAVLPILLLIALGYILRRLGFVNENFLKIGNKFTFRITLPVLLFVTIYSIESFSTINWGVIIYAVLGVLLLFVIGLILALVFIKDKRQKGPIMQVVYRANYAIIGIPLAQALGGDEAVVIVALVSAVIVPLINVLSVIALTLFVRTEDEDKHPLKSTLIKIVKNPLIISIFLGLLAIFIRSFIPIDPSTLEPVFTIKNNLPFLYIALSWIKNIASPLALIILGGTFEFLIIKNMIKEIFIGTFARVVLSPLITLPIAVILSNNTSFFDFSVIEYPALIALFASPTAISGAIMAKEMNNDEKLAVQLVVWTTALSILSIFIVVFIMRSLGYI